MKIPGWAATVKVGKLFHINFAEIPKFIIYGFARLKSEKKEKALVAPYTNTVQNNNKCPHGFPIGSCPICSGMGGAPKDRNKPRKSGEMSYNECLAVWHRMQRQEQRENQAELSAQKALLNNKKENDFLNKFNNFILKLESAKNQSIAPFKPIINVIGNAAKFVLSATRNIFAVYQNITQSLGQLLNFVSEKLSSFLGEIKNFVSNFKLISKTKKIIKTVLSLFLNKNSEEEQEENEEILRLKLREIQNSFLRIFIQNEEKTQEAEESKK